MENDTTAFVPNINIDKDFLISALGNDTEILSYNITRGSKPGDNYMSVIYAIDVELKKKELDSSVEKKHFLFKCLPSHPGRQEFNNKTNLFYRELQVYHTWLPEIMRFQKEVIGLKQPYKLPFTHAVAGKAVDVTKLNSNELDGVKMNPLDNFIMMEDLRKSYGFVMPDRKTPLNIHQMRFVVPAIATTQALGWIYKKKVTTDIPGKFPFLDPKLLEEGLQSWIDLADTYMNEELKVIEKRFGAQNEITIRARNFQQYIRPLFGVFYGKPIEAVCHEAMRVKNSNMDAKFPEPWISLMHGDCWSNNFLFRYDSKTALPIELTMIDLAFVQEACITFDLICVLYCGTTTEFRKQHLEDLLHLFTDTFIEVFEACNCPLPPGFNFDSFKARFHRAKAFGYVWGLSMFPIILKDDEATIDLETIDESQDFGEMLENTGGHDLMNPLVTERVLELVQEMYDEGII